MDHQTPRRRRQRPLRRSKARLARPLPPRPRHLRQSTRSPIPPRGLQPVPLEPLLELTFRLGNRTARPLQSDGPFLFSLLCVSATSALNSLSYSPVEFGSNSTDISILSSFSYATSTHSFTACAAQAAARRFPTCTGTSFTDPFGFPST